jgi:LysR family transcriptional regulator for bpeEF and oprC
MNQILSIRCFARIVETGSFTKAADSLDIPKATVSRLIQDLEEHLGVQLVQRTTRRLTITADGHAYYRNAEHLVRELENVDSNFVGDHASPRGKIRIDIGGSIGKVLLIPALPSFFKKYPEVEIVLGIGDRTVDLIEDNIDCVVRGGAMTELSLVTRLLGTSSWVTCATPAYLAEFGIPFHPNDLRSGHRMVGYHSAATGRTFPARFERGAECVEVNGPYSISVNDGLARVSAGLAGLGVIQTFSFMVKDSISRGELTPILEEWTLPRYPFHIVYLPNRKLSNRIRVFIDWLIEQFEQID